MTRRRVNNHNQIKLLTNQVGEQIRQQKLNLPAEAECAPAASAALIQVDGGHIPTQDPDKRSFEALSAVVYPPESLHTLDQNHREITSISCALSNREHSLCTITTSVLHAALQQGMIKATVVTALADGAHNCWSVIKSLTPECQQLAVHPGLVSHCL